MVTTVVDDHGEEKSQDTLSNSLYTGAAYNVRLLFSEDTARQREDVTIAPLKAFFRLQREPNLKSGRILVIIRMLRDSWSRMAALSAGAARRKLF